MKKKLFNTIIFLLGGFSSFAQQATDVPVQAPSKIPGIVGDPMSYIILFSMVILLATVIVMSRVIRLLTWQIAGKPLTPDKEELAEAGVKKETFWTKFGRSMNDAVPIEKEADVLLDHDYDGIKELDNNLPPWWKYGFYLTIIFAFLYMINYHVVGNGQVSLNEYNQQLADAEILKKERLKLAANNVDENTATLLTADADLSAGQKIFTEKCTVCHGKAGEGNVGPNLTDEYWIHGGDIKDVFKTVKYGFPSKGMLAWQGQLNPVQMQQVASYIKSLKGTNPPNPKAPQGNLYVEGGSAPVDSAATMKADTSMSAKAEIVPAK